MKDKILLKHLEDILNKDDDEGVTWYDREARIFSIKWSRVQKNQEAQFGIYKFYQRLKRRPLDLSHVKRNFRAALDSYVRKNKLRRIRELEEKNKSLRIYQFTESEEFSNNYQQLQEICFSELDSLASEESLSSLFDFDPDLQNIIQSDHFAKFEINLLCPEISER